MSSYELPGTAAAATGDGWGTTDGAVVVAGPARDGDSGPRRGRRRCAPPQRPRPRRRGGSPGHRGRCPRYHPSAGRPPGPVLRASGLAKTRSPPARRDRGTPRALRVAFASGDRSRLQHCAVRALCCPVGHAGPPWPGTRRTTAPHRVRPAARRGREPPHRPRRAGRWALPTSTSTPAGTRVLSSIPSASAGTSTSALSVSTTTTTSPFSNVVPSVSGHADRTGRRGRRGDLRHAEQLRHGVLLRQSVGSCYWPLISVERRDDLLGAGDGGPLQHLADARRRLAAVDPSGPGGPASRRSVAGSRRPARHRRRCRARPVRRSARCWSCGCSRRWCPSRCSPGRASAGR